MLILEDDELVANIYRQKFLQALQRREGAFPPRDVCTALKRLGTPCRAAP